VINFLGFTENEENRKVSECILGPFLPPRMKFKAANIHGTCQHWTARFLAFIRDTFHNQVATFHDITSQPPEWASCSRPRL